MRSLFRSGTNSFDITSSNFEVLSLSREDATGVCASAWRLNFSARGLEVLHDPWHNTTSRMCSPLYVKVLAHEAFLLDVEVAHRKWGRLRSFKPRGNQHSTSQVRTSIVWGSIREIMHRR